MRIYTSLDEHGLNRRSLKARPKRNLAQGRASTTSGTLGKMYPDGPRPTGARGNVRNVFPDGTSNVPCCHFAFPFGRRRVAPLPFPSAGDLRFRAQGMWVVRYPGCHPLRSFCPGLGSSCPFGTCASKCIVVQSFFLRQQRQRGQRNGAYMFNGVHFDRRGQ